MFQTIRSASAGIFLASVLPVTAIAGSLHAGVKGGLNVANINFDNSSDDFADSRTGMAVGAFVALPLSDVFSISPELLFTMKGDQEEITESGVTVKAIAKLDYLEIPVLARVQMASGSAATPWLAVGPAVGINVGSKLKGEASDPNNSASAELDIGDITKSVDFGVAFAGGVDFAIGESGKTVGVEGRFTLGLADVFEGDIDDQGNLVKTGASDGKTRTISILATFGLI